ncbi:MAG: hypothetical protein KAW46_04600, partial [candidate division Zixibacteria bacterium]|nr:hypothetical protein [candidate division Zixibacteria bacterium]
VTITVTNVNQEPVLALIGPQGTNEGVNLSFSPSASDPDGDTPVMSASALPGTTTYVDNGNGTGTFDWTPTFSDSGTYNVTFYAADSAFPAVIDSEIVTITVTNVNRFPILSAIGPQSVTEGAVLTFGTSASDPDGDIPAMTSSSLPGSATYIDNGNGTGTFSWTPSYIESGDYNVTFYATDGAFPSDIDSETVVITVVEAGNQDPVLAPIGPKSVTEGSTLAFPVTASDPESIPTLTASNLPAGAAFVDNGDGSGDFTWTPGYTESGTYNVTFFATDDSASLDGEVVTITVNEAGNQLPVLAAIGARSTAENVLLTFGVSATDAESIPSLSSSTLPTGAGFTDNGDGTGSFNWTPTFTQSGTYPITFYATDDSAAVDSEVVIITVTEPGNQLPVLAAIGSQSTTENVPMTFGVSATDADGAAPTLTSSTLPTGATFVDNGNGTGDFNWTPDYLQSGIYDVTFYATDDSAAVDSEVVTITVSEAGNQLPLLATIGAQSTNENVLLAFGVSATDVESTPTLTTSALPSGATFVDNGDGTGDFDWTPTYLQSGSYPITFYATDDSAAVDSETVTITVNEAGNQLPILSSIGVQSTTEAVLLAFGVSASDIESVPVLTTSTLPTGATFVDNGDGSGDFDWTPTYMQSGSYPVTFYAIDDSAAVDSEVVVITVNEAGNQLPQLAAIGSQSTTENVLLTIGVSATDAESTPLMTTSTLPTGATFVDNGNGSGDFNWTPGFTDVGIYSVTFYATDDSAAVDSEQVTITVFDAGNQSPVLDPIGPQATTENVNLNFGITASDPDATIPALSTSTLPTGATFIDNGDGSGVFDWTPGFTDAGIHNVTFYAD